MMVSVSMVLALTVRELFTSPDGAAVVVVTRRRSCVTLLSSKDAGPALMEECNGDVVGCAIGRPDCCPASNDCSGCCCCILLAYCVLLIADEVKDTFHAEDVKG